VKQVLDSVHYTLRTTSQTGSFVNTAVTYEVYFDRSRGIAYSVNLEAPPNELSNQLEPVWQAKIVNDRQGLRLEYDILQKIYYQTPQTMEVESALFKLQEDLFMFLQSSETVPVPDITKSGQNYPGSRLNTLTTLV